MVRQKQTFNTDGCPPSSSTSSSSNLLNPGFQAPVQKSGISEEWVQSSHQKRLEKLNEFDKCNDKMKIINLDEVNDEFFEKNDTESINQKINSTIRKRQQRQRQSDEQCEMERTKNKNRMILKRSEMDDEEIIIEREIDRNRRAMARKRKREDDGQFYRVAANHKNANFYELGPFEISCVKCKALHFPEEQSIKMDNGESFFSCCKNGKLSNLEEKIGDYPEELKVLFNPENSIQKKFISNIRRYNSAFACASISCFRFKFPTPGPPCYKIQGQVYHKFNPNAKPSNEFDIPTNGQLYFIDSGEATDLRCEMHKECDSNIMEYLDNYMRNNNKFAISYKMMKDIYESYEEICNDNGQEMPQIRLLFSLKDHYDQRRYNTPQSNEVCAIIVLDANDDVPPARIIVYPKGEKELKEIYPLDKCIDPMCYPLLYPTSTEGYHFGIKDLNGKKISLCDYTKFFLYFRENNKFFPHFYASKLFQQWIVDQCAKVEWDRLEYIRSHQAELCSSNYTNVEDFLRNKASKTGAEIQKKVILPSSFTGGPRNMHENFMDAMAIVNETGKPDLFITFTCNPNDPDILKCLFPGQTPSDRPDIVSRVFHLKKNYLLELIIDKQIFGEVIGYCWVIEYQKRGLPHLHLLITLHPKDKWRNTKDIDNFICAEIPNQTEEPELYEIVTKNMMHGPCTEKSLCWDKEKKKCKKKFPKPYRDETALNEDGYPLYKRTDNGLYIYKNGQKLSNQFVVPYNPYLSKTFKAHINGERVADITAVKYLYDYIYKGYDAATIECIQINQDGAKKVLKYDEVGTYLEARYLSPCEACWRIFKYPMQGKSHSVDQLDVHLEKKQKVFFKKNATEEEIQEASEKDTTLTAYFKFCQQNPEFSIKYTEMPKYCTWVKQERRWKYPRREGQKKIGRMIPVHPTDTEKYYLRYLLLNIHGKSFKDLRTVNGLEYDTYAEACLARGLAKDDNEWHKCMEEASYFSRKHPKGLRTLFVNILLHCGPKNPEKLWDVFKEHLCSDLKRRFPNLPINQIFNMGLKFIDQSLKYQDKSLTDFKKMPQITDSVQNIDEEDLYDPNDELKIANQLIGTMNIEQKTIIDNLRDVIEKNNLQKCVFIDGPGGTGKSYTLKAIYHLARAKNKKICNMAFSGIAATVLKKGRTLHNRFKLPLNIKKTSTSGIEINGKDAEEIKSTDIFVWDEAPMASRFVLDIIDRKLRELMGNDKIFGGKTFILSGDFRQCLPIKEFATRTEIVDLLIKNSPLWKQFTTMKLKQNMRADPNEREFARQLIEIGDGTAGEDGFIKVPDNCISNGDLISEIFEEIIINENFDELGKYAILSPLNTVVDKYNDDIMEKFPGNSKTFLSIDETDANNEFPASPELLNSLKCPSMPNHKIVLKKYSMIMLLRNLNVREGLCNGTRLQVIEAGDHVLNCIIRSGDKIGENILLPRITLIEDKKFPFLLRRHQFPIKIAFAFTINKSQSQTFSKIGIDYTDDPFTHGQTYVALSRVKSWNGIKIKLSEDNKEAKIKNIVWPETLC